MIVTRHTAVRTSRALRRSAFTLMEVLVVVAILVILAGVGSVAVFKYLDQAKEDTARMQIGTIENAVTGYKLKHGTFPDSLNALTQGDAISPQAYLEAKDIEDPWNQVFQYQPQVLSPTGKPKIFTTAPSGNVISNF